MHELGLFFFKIIVSEPWVLLREVAEQQEQAPLEPCATFVPITGPPLMPFLLPVAVSRISQD